MGKLKIDRHSRSRKVGRCFPSHHGKRPHRRESDRRNRAGRAVAGGRRGPFSGNADRDRSGDERGTCPQSRKEDHRRDRRPLEPVTDPRVAAAKGDLIVPPKKFILGDTDAAFKTCEHVFEGPHRTERPGTSLHRDAGSLRGADGEAAVLRVYSSTQGPTAVQRAVCRVTGLADASGRGRCAAARRRFWRQRRSGKCLGRRSVAVATQLTKRPVKYALHRMEDMRMTGKRHPYSSDYKIGLDTDLKIIAYEAIVLPERRCVMRPLAAGARTHAVSLHKLVFRPERHRDRLLLPDKSAAKYGISRLWRAAGDVCDRIGDRSRGGKAWRFGRARFRRRICSRTATNSPTARKPRATRSLRGRRPTTKYDFAQSASKRPMNSTQRQNISKKALR